MKKKLARSSGHIEHVSALILCLVHEFYTLKYVLSEVTEILPPYRIYGAGLEEAEEAFPYLFCKC